jgi:hypothetical protein
MTKGSIRRWRLPAVTLALMSLFLSGCGGASSSEGATQEARVISSHGRDAYTARNEGVLGSLPRYPGARLLTTWEHEQLSGNGWPEGMGPATAYTTTYVYEVPRSTSAELVKRFYSRALAGEWAPRGQDGSGMGFRRGPASLWVSLSAPPDDRPTTLLVAVDHDAYS